MQSHPVDTRNFSELFSELLGQQVILDTAEHVVFLGTLREITEFGFWLINADVHDCRYGHADKESYIYEACREGIRTNRSRLFVMRQAVIGVSKLTDVVPVDLGDTH